MFRGARLALEWPLVMFRNAAKHSCSRSEKRYLYQRLMLYCHTDAIRRSTESVKYLLTAAFYCCVSVCKFCPHWRLSNSCRILYVCVHTFTLIFRCNYYYSFVILPSLHHLLAHSKLESKSKRVTFWRQQQR